MRSLEAPVQEYRTADGFEGVSDVSRRVIASSVPSSVGLLMQSTRSAGAPARVAAWPKAVEPKSDTYTGEPYLGPWG